MDRDEILMAAMEGDIHAFQRLFSTFQDALRSYLYRLLASRADADDLTHDTFIRAFDNIQSFKRQSSLKTWVFTIATNLATNYLRKRNRWTEDVSQLAKNLVMADPDLQSSLATTATSSSYGKYEIKEHIDTCFTCISKVLPIENQVAMILKDIYDFSIKEIMEILNLSEGVVKYLIQNARSTLSEIFERRCALVNKNGVCHQCTELNGWFNPKQDHQKAVVALKMSRETKKYDRDALLAMRVQLVKAIDPLRSSGNELQEALMDCNRRAMGEY